MNKICRMGENYAFIKPNGDVERCCKDHSISLGNIINGTFKLLENPAGCNIDDCYCWRRMLVGEESKWAKYWRNNWDHFYCDEMRKIITELYNNKISFDDAYKKYIILKQKIYDKNLRYEEIDVMENNIISRELEIGWKGIEEGNFTLALNKSEQLLKYYNEYNPSHKIDVLMYNSRLNMALKNFERAKFSLEKIREIDKNNPAIYKLLAMIYFNLSEYKKAKKLFFKAVKLAKEICNNFELSEIYFEMSVYYENYYNMNKKINYDIYKKTMLTLLKKSAKYNSDNITAENKIKQINK